MWLGVLWFVLENLHQIREFLEVLGSRVKDWISAHGGKVEITVAETSGRSIKIVATGRGIDRIGDVEKQVAKLLNITE